ncbi:hypothetical protein FRB94_000367 [Tulasnella sp. JGI-2019a]|nr:hypothetical protein FRB94_000367 [Tulasnella sp. JGI-2019a]
MTGPSPGGPTSPPPPCLVAAPMDMNTALQETAEYLHTHNITTLALVATTCFLFYDIITTLDREVHYVWCSQPRFSSANIIFLLIRWAPLAYFFCTYSAEAPGYVATAFMMSMDVIFIARTWAIYQRSHTVLILLILSSMVCYIPALVIFYIGVAAAVIPDATIKLSAIGLVKASILGSSATKIIPDDLWVLETCFIAQTPKLLGITFLVSLFYESILFGAMIGRLLQYGTSSSKLLDSMYRDGMSYFTVILLAHLVGAITCFYGPIPAAIDGSFYFIGIKSVMCSHVVLRLRASLATRDAVIDGHHRSIHSGEPVYGGLARKAHRTDTQMGLPPPRVCGRASLGKGPGAPMLYKAGRSLSIKI